MLKELVLIINLFVIVLLCEVFAANRTGTVSSTPDTSADCLLCQETVEALQIAWTNETVVDEILKNLDKRCNQKFSFKDAVKLKICKEIASVFVKIPPALFHEMSVMSWPIPEAVCATIFKCHVNCCDDDNSPEQVHLSTVSSDSSIVGVTWITLNSNSSVIEYGSSSNLNMSIKGFETTYKAAGWIGTIHRAIMTNLQPGLKYYYRVGDGITNWSETFTFSTFSEGQDLTFAILADMDYSADLTIQNIATLVADAKVHAVIHSGDISYADGYEPHWDLFFNKIQPIAAHVPYMASPGNHELFYNFSSFKHRFFFPSAVSSTVDTSIDSHMHAFNSEGVNGMYYSWNAGNTHFISANSETAIDTADFSESFLVWLEEDLKSVDRSQSPRVVMHVHRPMYCTISSACTTGGGDKLRGQVEDLINAYKVNLVISGHVHSYERTLPVYHNKAVGTGYNLPEAPVYVVQGASGCSVYGYSSSTSVALEEHALDALDCDWFGAKDLTSVGFGLLTISASQMKFQYFASRDEAFGGPLLMDEFTMIFND